MTLGKPDPVLETAKKRALTTMGAFTLGLAMCYALFTYRTPKCNETCPPWIGLSMYATLLLLPIMFAAAGFLRKRGAPAARLALALLLCYAALLSALVWK